MSAQPLLEAAVVAGAAPTDEQPALLASRLHVGQKLDGRYVVRERIAEGAAAIVYRAFDETQQIEVALKVLDPLRSADPVGHARFMRELEVLSRVAHRGVARCLRRFTDRGLEVLVLELCEGETLAAVLETRGRLGVQAALACALQLAEALQACHDADVLHRDLKPDNVQIDPQRGAVILDFGAAWFSSAANLTRTGAVIGSPRYLAPEAFSSSLVDARADIYSLGVMLFEMLAGRPLHFADSVAEMVKAHAEAEVPSLCELRPDVGEPIARVVERAIAVRPEDRFASARELSLALCAASGIRCGRLLRGQQMVALESGAGGELEPARELTLGRPLQSRISCKRCSTPLLIDLPFCPGCGAEVDWALAPGAYAVELVAVEDETRCARWITARYGHALVRSARALRRRLRHLPAPLIIGASITTAEQIAAEARELGCTVRVARSRPLVGPALAVAEATVGEALVVAPLHIIATLLLGFSAMALFGARGELALIPALVSVAGVFAVRRYVRRPILRCVSARASESPTVRAELEPIRAQLRALGSDRARRLAAMALARAAAPLIAGNLDAADASTLDDALESVGAVDAQLAFLEGRSRSALGTAIAEAQAQLERGADGAAERLMALQQEREAIAEASLAHDMAVRRALAACEALATASLQRHVALDEAALERVTEALG